MSNQLTYEVVMAALPDYVLGTLSQDEMVAIDNYINHQRALLGALHEHEESLAQLAHAAPEVALPPEIRAALLAQVRSTLHHQRPRTHRLPDPWRWGALAALILLTLLGLYTARLQQEMDTLREQQQEARLLASLDRVLWLPGTEEAPAARGTLYLGDESAIIVLEGLPALPPEQAYQLWVIPPEGDPISAGLLEVGTQPLSRHLLRLPPAPSGISAVGLSLEPAGGSLAPTGPILLLGEG